LPQISSSQSTSKPIPALAEGAVYYRTGIGRKCADLLVIQIAGRLLKLRIFCTGGNSELGACLKNARTCYLLTQILLAGLGDEPIKNRIIEYFPPGG